MPQSPVVYALDIGSTHTRGGVFRDGVTEQTAVEHTPRSHSAGECREQLMASICRIVDQTSKTSPRMDAVAVSVAGVLRLAERHRADRYGVFSDHEPYLWSPEIEGLKNLAFLEWLESAGWNVPIHVENDVNAALLTAAGTPSALGINLNSGIEAAIKRDGKIEHIGNSWSCYEMGHGFRWQLPDELVCKCVCGSMMGCLDAAIGWGGLSKRYGVRPQDASPEVYARMRGEVVTHLSPAIADTAHEFGLSKVLLSGFAAWRFADGFDLVAALKSEMGESRPDIPTPDVELVDFGETAGMHGAALALLDNSSRTADEAIVHSSCNSW